MEKNNLLSSLIRNIAKYKNAPDSYLSPNGLVFIYGKGTFARDILHALLKNGIDVSGFLDHREKEGRNIEEHKVYPPDSPEIDKDKATVVIGIHNREVDILKIITRLEKLGYKNIISVIDPYDYFAKELGNRYWLTSRTNYSSFKNELSAVYELLTDQKSRDLFESIIRFRITGDYPLHSEPDWYHHYFPPDLPAWREPIRFVDCGAYDGDTIQAFLQTGFNLQATVAIESDQDNYQKLSAYVAKNRKKLPNTFLFPCGVHSSTAQLYFDTGKGEASVKSQTGSRAIQSESLDECICTFHPTLIKMDIEGAEMEALPGAQQSIKENRPALAISIYHTPAHLWEIPSLIDNITTKSNLHYTYPICAHANNCFDTVFYAIPEGNSHESF